MYIVIITFTCLFEINNKNTLQISIACIYQLFQYLALMVSNILDSWNPQPLTQ